MAKAVTDKDKLQIPLKIDRIKDREIFDVLNVADNRSDFIKDALFYFVHQIEAGKIINRNYPYNKLNIRIDIAPEEDVDIPQQEEESINQYQNDIEEYDNHEEDDSEDNFDDVDF